MKQLWISDSYGKINLGLNVLERLENGYHNIESGFCFIEWSDRFEVAPASRNSLTMSNPDIPIDDSNLIVKAVQLLENEAGLKDKFHIHVQKNIPVGAGLGGGSSNAATTLRMLNKIANLGLSEENLLEFGKQIGADVPFFIKGVSGFATGTGSDIEELDIQPDAFIITCFPDVYISTEEVYELVTPNPEPDFSLRNILTEEDIEEWELLLLNDLELVVFPRQELVGNVKDQFYEFGASYASMSGSGSSVYGLFKQEFVAIHAYDSFHKLGFITNLTRPKYKPDFGVYIKEIGY